MIRDKSIEIKDKVEQTPAEARTKAEELAKDAKAKAEELQRRGQVILEEQRTRIEQAIDAGKKAAQSKRAQISGD